MNSCCPDALNVLFLTGRWHKNNFSIKVTLKGDLICSFFQNIWKNCFCFQVKIDMLYSHLSSSEAYLPCILCILNDFFAWLLDSIMLISAPLKGSGTKQKHMFLVNRPSWYRAHCRVKPHWYANAEMPEEGGLPPVSDQLLLFQPGGADNAHNITTAP